MLAGAEGLTGVDADGDAAFRRWFKIVAAMNIEAAGVDRLQRKTSPEEHTSLIPSDPALVLYGLSEWHAANLPPLWGWPEGAVRLRPRSYASSGNGGGGGGFGGGGLDFGGGEEFGGEEFGGEEAGGEFGEGFRGDDDVIDKLLVEGKKRNEDILAMTKGIDDLLNEEDDDNDVDQNDLLTE